LSANWKKNDFLKNVLILLSGNSLAQLISILMIPVLARYFLPEQWGMLGAFVAISGWAGVIAALRYDLAIMLPKSNDDAKKLAKISIGLSAIVAAILAIPILIFKLDIAIYLNEDGKFDAIELSNWFYLIPVSIFLFGFNSAITMWQTRKKRFSQVAGAGIGRSITSAGVNLSAGIAKMGSGGLIAGQFLGQAVNGLILALGSLKNILSAPVPSSERKRLMKEYKDFPLKSGPAILLNLTANQLPILLILPWFGAGVAGQFFMMQKILNIPLTFIGKSVGHVFYQKSNENLNAGISVRPLVIKTSLTLLAIIIIPMTVLFFFGEPIFETVLGSEFKEAGRIAGVFAIFYLFRFIFSTQSTLLTSKRKLTVEILFNACFLITQVGSVIYGYFTNDYNLAFKLMAVSGSALFLILGVLIFKYAGDK
jgi:lipopolysaccharide exporter